MAAASLLEAQEETLEDVWKRFTDPVVLKTVLEAWRDGCFANLSETEQEQRETRNWLVPTAFVLQVLPDAVADQNETQVASVIEVVSRTLERINSLTTLTGAQDAAILAAYNASFGV